MTFKTKGLFASGASALAIAGAASAAFAAAPPVFPGTTGTPPPPTTTTTVGTSSTTTTGSSTVAPYTTTVTTVQNQTVNSTTNPQTTAVAGTADGVAYTGTITVSGAGAQAQTSTSGVETFYNPGPPPTVNHVVDTGPTVANVGGPTVTAVSASGQAGTLAAPAFGSTLATSGPIVGGSVTATENDVFMSTSGATYSTYVGSATYNPGSGNVTVALPTVATNSSSLTSGGLSVTDGAGNSTVVSSTGLTTTGSVSAASVSASTVTAGTVYAGNVNATNVTATNVTANSISTNSLNLNGGQISGVGAGTAPDDAVNLAQLQAGLNRLRTQAASGTSVAAAMSGLVFIPGKKFNFSVDVADYLGQGAVAANFGILVTPSIALNAGVGTGFNYGGTAGRAGITLGF